MVYPEAWNGTWRTAKISTNYKVYLYSSTDQDFHRIQEKAAFLSINQDEGSCQLFVRMMFKFCSIALCHEIKTFLFGYLLKKEIYVIPFWRMA